MLFRRCCCAGSVHLQLPGLYLEGDLVISWRFSGLVSLLGSEKAPNCVIREFYRFFVFDGYCFPSFERFSISFSATLKIIAWLLL